MIAGLDHPTGGTIEFATNRVNSRRGGGNRGPGLSHPDDILPLEYASHRASEHKTAYVFQDAHLLPWRNVLSNVMLPLEFAKLPRAQRKLSAFLALEQVGLADAIDRYPAQLSGGMRMRVSLARALVTEPNLLLLDEPFAALDEITRQKLDEQLRQLWQKRGMTIVFVTHSTTEATFLSDRAIVLTSRPATIVADFAINLPKDRTGPLRATAEFAAQTRAIYEALDRGSADPAAVDRKLRAQRELDEALEKLADPRAQNSGSRNLSDGRKMNPGDQ
jgi:NitT/TauT family transport system ATP-binding protein